MNITNVTVRKYIYGILVAASPVAVAYGLVTITQAGLWVALGGAVLGLSNLLAFANVPKDGKHEAE